MNSEIPSTDHWTQKVTPFAETHQLSRSLSSYLMNEFDGDFEQALIHLETRYRPAMKEWESFENHFGIQQPFPVRMPLPRGGRVYHKLHSLTFSRQVNTITLRGTTVFLGKPGSWNDAAKCTFSHDFEYLPEVRTLEDIFEHWAPVQREKHSLHLASPSNRGDAEDEMFYRNPASWTLSDFLERSWATVSQCGAGTRISLRLGWYFGECLTTYLLSEEGCDGTLVTGGGFTSVNFDADKFVIGRTGDFPDLPIPTEAPFEFLRRE
ncbi:MAG: hypothetical protein JWP89_523 [Schlesneria sp.]|nr:hypothetical protein [Schlesneria sp.]